MNSFELKKLKSQLEKEEGHILFSKGTEYVVSNDDRLNFFREYADKLGADPKMVCSIFLMKHINSILNYVKTGKESVEGIRGRIMDARNYLLFMEALIEETKDMEKVGGTCDDDTIGNVTARCTSLLPGTPILMGGKVTTATEDEVHSQRVEDGDDWVVFENDHDYTDTEMVDGDD